MDPRAARSPEKNSALAIGWRDIQGLEGIYTCQPEVFVVSKRVVKVSGRKKPDAETGRKVPIFS